MSRLAHCQHIHPTDSGALTAVGGHIAGNVSIAIAEPLHESQAILRHVHARGEIRTQQSRKVASANIRGRPVQQRLRLSSLSSLQCSFLYISAAQRRGRGSVIGLPGALHEKQSGLQTERLGLHECVRDFVLYFQDVCNITPNIISVLLLQNTT